LCPRRRSLKTQIELLKVNPESLRDRVVATREHLEQSHAVLVEDLRHQIADRDSRFSEFVDSPSAECLAQLNCHGVLDIYIGVGLDRGDGMV